MKMVMRRERETDRQTDRQRQTDRDRQTESDRQRQSDSDCVDSQIDRTNYEYVYSNNHVVKVRSH